MAIRWLGRVHPRPRPYFFLGFLFFFCVASASFWKHPSCRRFCTALDHHRSSSLAHFGPFHHVVHYIHTLPTSCWLADCLITTSTSCSVKTRDPTTVVSFLPSCGFGLHQDAGRLLVSGAELRWILKASPFFMRIVQDTRHG